MGYNRNFALSVATIGQSGAIAALNHPEEIRTLRDLYKSRRDYALEIFKELEDIGIRPLPPEGGFYFTLDISEFLKQHHLKSSLELVQKMAKETTPHVCVAVGDDFRYPNSLRLSFSDDRFNEGVTLIKHYLQNFCNDSKI